MDDEVQGNRFAYLLQPIRDLARNWDIDIAQELESYLEELAQIAVSVDGGQTHLNFAEAALLIQGSTAVYGKKVEYLYQLVCAMLDMLSHKKKKQEAGRKQKGDADGDGVGTGDDGPEGAEADDGGDEDFMDMENVRESGAIVLREDELLIERSRRGPVADASRLIPPMPMSLVPLEDFEKMDVPILSRNGEVVGKKDDFRINTCFMHPSGLYVFYW